MVMEIQIKSCIEGAKSAEGMAVVIDVLRASSTIVTALDLKAKFIIPVEKTEDALKLVEENPDYILSTDNSELKDMGYHDNSPAEISKLPLKGKGVVLLTANGTRGMVNARKAKDVLVGCFLNANAIIDYLREANEPITLVPMGEKDLKAIDDELCAQYLKTLLEGGIMNVGDIKTRIINSEVAQYLVNTNREDDVNRCLTFNKYNIVPKIINGRIINAL